MPKKTWPIAQKPMSKQLSTTTQLIRRYQNGDNEARNELMTRYWSRLRRWAHSRLPATARDLSDTDDLVQVTFTRASGRLDQFQAERPGAFLAYLRCILRNLIREELRKANARPDVVHLDHSLPSTQLTPAEIAANGQSLDAYEQALNAMSDTKRLAIMMRLEFGMSYREIANELEQPSEDSTRMLTTRAIADLVEYMRHERSAA